MSVQSDTEIWATTHNAYSAGSRVMIFVEGPNGKSDQPPEAAWLTLGQAAQSNQNTPTGPKPNVESIYPTEVANPGTDAIGIYGTGFTDATTVWIGDDQATSMSVQSDTEIWATTHNAYSAGSRVMIFVEGPNGKSDQPPEATWLTLGQAAS